MASRVGLLVAVVPVVAAVACGTRTDATTATAVAIERADFAAAYAHAFCDDFGGCCRAAGLSPDASACVSKLVAALQSHIEDELARGRRYDALAAARCVAAIKELVPACFVSPKQSDRMWTTCAAVFSSDAHAAPGDPCESDSDCAPSTDGEVHCVESSAFEDGGVVSTFQCQVLTKPYAGEPCGFSFGGPGPSVLGACSFGEDPEFTCDVNTSTCVPRKPIGDPCYPFADDCVPTAFCNPEGTCAARLAAGSPCSPDATNECGPFLYCDATSETCLAKRPDGSACSDNGECAGGRCAVGACNQSVATGEPSYLCSGSGT